MAEIKPVRYNLIVCFGSVDGDAVGFESSTPFVPFSVGDYINPRPSNWAFGVELATNQALRVFAVVHSFQEFESHISQYVHVCVEVGDL